MSVLFLLTLFNLKILSRGELWEEDLSSAMTIGLSTTGYESVDLRCESNRFLVNVTVNDDFRGVIYTRGSFEDKKLPCFKRHHQSQPGSKGKMVIGLRIPFDRCKTLMDVSESRYANTLVVQHDPDLIMPGDAAFALDCAFVPEFTAKADVKIQEPDFKSKITLVDADPSGDKKEADGRRPSASSNSETVRFIPRNVEKKDEL